MYAIFLYCESGSRNAHPISSLWYLSSCMSGRKRDEHPPKPYKGTHMLYVYSLLVLLDLYKFWPHIRIVHVQLVAAICIYSVSGIEKPTTMFILSILECGPNKVHVFMTAKTLYMNKKKRTPNNREYYTNNSHNIVDRGEKTFPKVFILDALLLVRNNHYAIVPRSNIQPWNTNNWIVYEEKFSGSIRSVPSNILTANEDIFFQAISIRRRLVNSRKIAMSAWKLFRSEQ